MKKLIATAILGLCLGCFVNSNAQDIIAKLRAEYIRYVNKGQIDNKKLQFLFTSAGISQARELFPINSKSSVLDGMLAIDLKDAIYKEDVQKILIQSGYFQYVEIPAGRVNSPLHVPSDPFAAPNTGSQYYLEKVNAYKAWDVTRGDTNMTICIVDNGIDYNHPEFQGKIQINKMDTVDGFDNDNDGFIDNYRGWDFANNDNYPEDSTGAAGHGSEVTGIAAALTNNNLGIASMGYNCRFLPYKIFGDKAVSSNTQYEAVAYAALLGCKVINMSWGIYGTANDFYQYEQDLLNYAALEKDAVLVGATFPKEGDYFTFPGDYDNVISVLSLFADDTKSIPQATHYWIDMSVPGLDMTTTSQKGTYGTFTGISVGLPLVSGAAALARIRYPNMNALQIQELLRVTARNIDTVKTNVNYREKLGHGCLDAFKALTDTLTPAIRIKEYELKRVSGDTVSLQLGFINYLYPSKNLKLTFTPVSGGFNVYDSTASAGTVNTLDSAVTTFADFKFKILPYSQTNNIALLRIGIEDTVNHYFDYQYIYIDKNFESIITTIPQTNINQDNPKIYPNPFTDQLIVEVKEGQELMLSDFTGKLLMSEAATSEIVRFDTSELPSGMYFLQSRKDQISSVTKVIKK